MVVGAFPVAKLGALILKQVSKPLANVVKRRAKSSPFFRTYICMPPAQFYHWAEVKMKMWSMNLGKPVNIPKLNEALAIDLGAELLGEGIIFVIAAAILIAEYIRSTRKEEKKEEERLKELIQIQNDLRDLYLETAKQDAHIRELVRILQLKMPDVSYTPKAFNHSLIPEHHTTNHKGEEESLSIYGSLKGWVWSAIDLIVPEVEDDRRVDNQPQYTPTIVVTPKEPSLTVPHPPPTGSGTPQSPSQNKKLEPPPLLSKVDPPPKS